MGFRVREYGLGRHQTQRDIEVTCRARDIFKGSSILNRTVTDCGLLPRNEVAPGLPQWVSPDFSLFQDGVKIDAVRITHIHGDHVGYLPAIVPYLKPKAKIFMTRPSAAMLQSILEEGIGINQKKFGKQPYDYGQMIDVLSRIRIINRPGEIELVSGFWDYVHPEAHIPGACSFTTRVGKANIHYSGDRCSHGQPGVRGAELLPAAWRPHVIAGSDCTYGADPDSDKRTWKEEMDRGFDVCVNTVKSGHPALWFSFGVHRSGAMAHEMQRRGLPDIAPVFLDGSGRHFTDIVMSPDGKWCELDEPLDIDRVVRVKSKMRSSILRFRGYTVIATPGMGGPGGIGTWWRRFVLPDAGAAVIFTGFVAPGTDGEKILRAAQERDLTGQEVSIGFLVEDEETGEMKTETIPIRCQVVQIRTGSHDSRGKILDWFRGYRPQIGVLTHGSKLAFDSLERELKSDIPYLFRGDYPGPIEFEI